MEVKGLKKNEWSQSKRVNFDPVKEMESPRFRAIIRATNGRKKRGDVKSSSHELNCEEHHQLPLRKLGGVTTIDELTNVIKVKFSRLKDEVNSELAIYACDLITILERSSSSHPDWRSPFEDLLVISQKCTEMPADEFWVKCEGIVQTLDDRRQELPAGTLKQAHTRILFILTRCTRLLQFQKDEHALALHQLSDLGVYSSNEGQNSGDSQKETQYANIEDENLSDNSVGQSATARAAQLNSKFKERTTIEDFGIIKPISRGALGWVFLAKKTVIGVLFAIKVIFYFFLLFGVIFIVNYLK